MFRKNILKSDKDLAILILAYRKKGYLPQFKRPEKFPCVIITYTDTENCRLDYMGEVYNCYIYIDTLKEMLQINTEK